MTDQGDTMISKILSYFFKSKSDAVQTTDLCVVGTTLLLKNICDKHLKIITDEGNLKMVQGIYALNKNFLKALDKLNACSKKELLHALPRLHYVYDLIGNQKN